MDKEFDKSLGEALRNKRQEKNLSQEYVAQQLGVTKTAWLCGFSYVLRKKRKEKRKDFSKT